MKSRPYSEDPLIYVTGFDLLLVGLPRLLGCCFACFHSKHMIVLLFSTFAKSCLLFSVLCLVGQRQMVGKTNQIKILIDTCLLPGSRGQTHLQRSKSDGRGIFPSVLGAQRTWSAAFVLQCGKHTTLVPSALWSLLFQALPSLNNR